MIRLGDVTFLVRDHEAALRFFVDGLRFVVRQDQTSADGWRRLVVGPEGGGAGFVLALVEDDDPHVGRQAGDDVAFCHSLNRVSGRTGDGVVVDMWWRATNGFRRIPGGWVVTHGHSSEPFDMTSGKALTDLQP